MAISFARAYTVPRTNPEIVLIEERLWTVVDSLLAGAPRDRLSVVPAGNLWALGDNQIYDIRQAISAKRAISLTQGDQYLRAIAAKDGARPPGWRRGRAGSHGLACVRWAGVGDQAAVGDRLGEDRLFEQPVEEQAAAAGAAAVEAEGELVEVSRFPDDEACLDYLEWLRWPDGFRCPRCAGRDGWRLGSGRWECAVCGRQASVTAGTIFHRTRTPLQLWFAAAWQMTSQKHGVSALGVQRSLGLGSYQTA